VSPALVQRFNLYFWNLIPVATILLLVFVTVVPWRLPGFGAITPAFILMAVFYWSIYRPDQLSYVAVFCLGTVQDLLSGMPLGMTPLVLLIVQGILISQRRFLLGKSFFVVWCSFMIVALGAAILSWVVGTVFFGAPLAPVPIVVQVVMTVLLYPALTWLFGRAHLAMLRYG